MSEEPARYEKSTAAMTDADRERMEQLTEAIGECLATIAALREELAAVRADLAAGVEAQRQSVAAMQLHGHQLEQLTAAIERMAPPDRSDERGH